MWSRVSTFGAVKTHYKATRPKKGAVREGRALYSVREAKAHFSELIRMVEQGAEITITSHGQPKVHMIKAGQPGRPFRVARHWLKHMKVVEPQTPAEQIIREDRDARG